MNTNFSGYEYLQIDVANNAPLDLDKIPYPERIAWTTSHNADLEEIGKTSSPWKEKPLYTKAVMALRKTQKGLPTGHMMHFDAVCSGAQIASALTGCVSGSTATGLVHPNVRADLYTDVQKRMGNILGRNMSDSRKDVKLAVMSALYGSKAEPRALFGDETPELEAFNKALFEIATGASLLLEMLISSWQPDALEHKWVLPDGFVAKIKVMVPKTTRIEVDELDHSTFTYAYEDNEPTEHGLSLAANVIHSCDAYLLRSVIRRCSYDAERVTVLNFAITYELLERETGVEPANFSGVDESLDYYIHLYATTGVVDTVVIPYLDENLITILPTDYLAKLNSILEMMLEQRPFPVITVHDSYAAHPNNINVLRNHYRNVLADMSESSMLSDILSQINGRPITVNKLSVGLPETIRKSNYAIC